MKRFYHFFFILDFIFLWEQLLIPKIKPKKIILSSYSGNTCKKSGQHSCLKIGWDPILCVSDALVCDGIYNCPKGSLTSDEDEKLCRNHIRTHTSWEQLAVKIFKKLQPPDIFAGKWTNKKAPLEIVTTPVNNDTLWDLNNETSKLLNFLFIFDFTFIIYFFSNTRH